MTSDYGHPSRTHTPLFGQVLKLIAVKQNRNKKKSVCYKATGSDYVSVLKQLRIVSRVEDPNAKVDRMWERMTEVALFVRTGRHRSPADVLKGFIKAGTERQLNPEHALLSKEELSHHAAFDRLSREVRSIGSS
ncbi:MAG: hypothetical protein H0X44_00540 [Acidobacteria bacterium]|nr:hypothetical protein [Acidobacteriota bacterium]